MRTGSFAWCVGIVLLQQFASLPHWVWIAALAGAAVPLSFSSIVWRRLPGLCLLGFCYAWCHAVWALEQRLPAVLEGRDLLIEGIIVSLPEQRGRYQQFALQPDTLLAGGATVAAVGTLRLRWYGAAPSLRGGERWRLRVRLKRPHGLMNPAGFDYETWLFQQAYAATGYVRNGGVNQRLAPAPAFSLHGLRQKISDRIAGTLTGHANHGVVTALAVGQRGALAPAQWDLLLATGTNHLLAISGLHIGLVAGLAFWVVRRAWSWSARATNVYPAPKAAAWAALGAAAFYALLAGFAIPTQRALIMVAVVMGAVVLGRPVQPSRLLALALTAVLVLDPRAVLAAGFWLSFGAVSVILYAACGRRRPLGAWRGAIYVQAWVAVGLLPMTLIWYGRVACFAALANALAVPWVSFVVVPLALLGAVLPGPGAYLLYGADAALQPLWWWLRWVATLPGGTWTQFTPPPWTWPAAVAGVVLLLAPRGWPGRWLGVVFLLPLFMVRPPAPPPGAAWVSVLDVGQGLAVVVRTRHHTLVYDTGPRYSARFDTGRAVVVPYLRQHGVAAVDRLVVSHGDNDHSGGAAGLLSAVQVGQVLSGAPEALPAGVARHCIAGQGWQWDGVRFDILHPPATGGYTGNDGSCVLRIAAGPHSLLLTGDIQRAGEQALLRRPGGLTPVTVLVAPHHGSLTSSSAAFVAATAPRYVVFATGYRNRFGHPRAAVVARYRRRGVGLFNTAADGAVEFRLGPLALARPQGWRHAARRYWHAVPKRGEVRESY